MVLKDFRCQKNGNFEIRKNPFNKRAFVMPSNNSVKNDLFFNQESKSSQQNFFGFIVHFIYNKEVKSDNEAQAEK
ncbi:MAG: hypothetical protein N2445_08820, partial [Acidobacteria bacterium]|nr:hypothetical protein [Acidobacteriota bacterium]